MSILTTASDLGVGDVVQWQGERAVIVDLTDRPDRGPICGLALNGSKGRVRHVPLAARTPIVVHARGRQSGGGEASDRVRPAVVTY